MDFEQNNNRSEPLQPQPLEPIYGLAQGASSVINTPKKRTGWRIFWGIILGLSVLANIALFLILIGLAVVFVTGQEGIFTEEVIQAGPRTAKIAVITVQGIIDDEQAQDVYKQIKSARQDKRVKGLILRVNSPGGTISGSDRICNEIRKYREKEGKPVVAFMQGVAASGGYYVSVGCDQIVAEPTAITGSIGVIAGHFVLQGLLEEKLGVSAAAPVMAVAAAHHAISPANKQFRGNPFRVIVTEWKMRGGIRSPGVIRLDRVHPYEPGTPAGDTGKVGSPVGAAVGPG